MPKDKQASDDPTEANQKDDSPSHATVRTSPDWLRWVIIGGVVAFVALLFTSIFLPNLTERVKFFTGNLLSLLVLLVIIVQALIYRGQWDAMQEQLKAMKDQTIAMQDSLTETRNLVTHSERAVEVSKTQLATNFEMLKASKQSIEIAQENTIIAQRAYLVVSKGTAVVAENHGKFTLIVKNFGNTPASEVRVMSKAEFRPEPPSPLDIINADWLYAGVIAPTDDFNHVIETARMSHDLNLLVIRRELQLYAWGVIQYRDIFGKLRQTRFNFFKRSGCAEFAPCKTGNEAD